MRVIILAGGVGTRLWPLSRDRYPKQFIKFQGQKHSLFQETFKRSLLLTDVDDIYIVTNKKYIFLVMADIEELGYKYQNDHILAEPEAKNTLPAIYAGVNEILKKGHDSVIVFSSDHIIRKNEKFAKLIRVSEDLTKEYLITFGIKPDRPHTGYGYISPGKGKDHGFLVREFKEKPDYKNALKYIQSGYFWNSGIFMFHTRIFLEEISAHASYIPKAFLNSETLEEAFSKITVNISIDYGILEKSNRIMVIPADIGWNDLGCFDSFYDVFRPDKDGNVVPEDVLLLNSRHNIIHVRKGKLAVIVGVDDVIMIDADDALLVCKKGQSQKLKQIVDRLKERKDLRTQYHMQDYRPWGDYKVLDEKKNTFKIKRIRVNPGKKLSYQYHHHRSEHWIVLRGMARVTIDDKVQSIPSGGNVFIKARQKHRLENDGDQILEIIEVQTGDYLEEDDIVRLNDEYGRN